MSKLLDTFKMSEEIFITTESIDPYIRTDFYRSLFSTFLDVSPVDQHPLYGSIHIRSANNWTLTHWQFGIQRCDRRQNLILQSDIEAYILILIVKGYFHRTTQKNSVRVEVGDLLLINTAQADSCISTGENTAIYIPRDLLEKHMGHYRIPDETIFRAKQPMTQLITDYVLSLFNVSIDLPHEEIDPAFDALLSLLVVRLKNDNMQTKQEINIVLKHRILQFIDLNIKNPNLCVESLIYRFNVSRAHLYRAFEADCGIATIIRNKRLDLIYLELNEHPISLRTLTEIAQDYGFDNYNQFLRAFRLRFGMSPSEAKNQYIGEPTGILDLTKHFMTFADLT